MQFEDTEFYKGCYINSEKFGTTLYDSNLTNGLYFFSTSIIKELLTSKKLEAKPNVGDVHKILCHIGVDRNLKASLENGGILKLEN